MGTECNGENLEEQENNEVVARNNALRGGGSVRPQNLHALALLRAWAYEPDDLGAEWWDSFERDLRQCRFSLRKRR
jgi:hypothetical protein